MAGAAGACPECLGQDLEEDPAQAFVCCRDCGAVVPGGGAGAGAAGWDAGGAPAGAALPAGWDAGGAPAGAALPPGREAARSAARRARAARDRLETVAHALRLGEAARRDAASYFGELAGGAGGAGAWVDRLAGACCYLAARQRRAALTLADVGAAVGADPRAVGSAYRAALGRLGVAPPAADPAALRRRVAAEAEAGGWGRPPGGWAGSAAAGHAAFLHSLADEAGLAEGRQPLALAAACVLPALRHAGCPGATAEEAEKVRPPPGGAWEGGGCRPPPHGCPPAQSPRGPAPTAARPPTAARRCCPCPPPRCASASGSSWTASGGRPRPGCAGCGTTRSWGTSRRPGRRWRRGGPWAAGGTPGCRRRWSGTRRGRSGRGPRWGRPPRT